MARLGCVSCLVALTLLVVLLPATKADDGPAFKAENSATNLKAFFTQLHQTIHTKKDAKAAVAHFRSLAPDEARLKKAVRDDAGAALRQILEMHKSMPVDEAALARLVKAEQSEVQVHAATTEEIARYERDSTAFKEFPSAAKRAAEQVLRPGVTFYEVEFVEPGRDTGMKLHLIYWDGKQWSMLGPVSRVLR